MKKIAVVISSLSSGGAERTVSNIVTHLPEGYEADIILNDTASITYPYRGTLLSLGLKPRADKSSLLYQAHVLFKRVCVLRRLKRKNHYAAVLSFMDSANVANILSGKKHCKCIVSVRVNLSKAQSIRAYRYIVSPLVRLLYNRADKVVALSCGAELDLTRNFGLNPQTVTTIYNGIDSDVVRKRFREPLPAGKKFWKDTEYTLVTMGRLVDQKGQWHLIRSLQVLKERGLHFQLLVLGQGPLLEYLQDLSQGLGMAENIVFCGFCDNPFQYLKEADLCVFPSLYEGFGNTLLEAMCCGVPCIASDYDSGAREILAPDTDLTYKNMDRIEYAKYGVLVPVCDGRHYQASDPLTGEEKLMGQAVCELLLNGERRREYQERQKQRVQEFDLDQIVQEWVQVIEA